MARKRKRQDFETEYKEYEDKLNDEEKKFIKKFYSEMYNADFYRQNTEDLCSDEEWRKEAHERKNSLTRDALLVAKTQGMLFDMDNCKEQYLRDANDEYEWNEVYRTLGYAEAFDHILNQTLNEFNEGAIEEKLILIRFYSKVRELDKTHNKEKRK